MARIFVTGGTGFVGRHVIHTALNRDHEVVALVRSEEKAQMQFQGLSNLEFAQGDIADKVSMMDGMDGCDAVIHLVGIIVERPNKGITFASVHYQGTVNVVSAAEKVGIPRYVHMSALGVRPEGQSQYQKTKWAAEEYVRSSGLDRTIFRPSIIFGPEDDFINQFARIIRLSPIVPIIGSGKNRFQPIWVDDVASCFIQAVERPKTVGKEYGLAGPEEFSFEELIDVILRVMRKRRLKIKLPMVLARLNAAFLEKVLDPPPLTRDQLIQLQDDNVCSEEMLCDPGAMLRDFEIDPRPLEEGIREYL